MVGYLEKLSCRMRVLALCRVGGGGGIERRKKKRGNAKWGYKNHPKFIHSMGLHSATIKLI